MALLAIALRHVRSMQTMVRAIGSQLPMLDGNHIPMLGLGVYLAPVDGETEKACLWALKHGYRHIDTAEFYKNEDEVGSAIRKSGIPREDVFVTTKLCDSFHGEDNTTRSCKQSLRLYGQLVLKLPCNHERLGLEYIDLYLMHSPLEGQVVETWQTMVELQQQGLVKSVGVSNFNVHHLEGLKKACPYHIPTVNQIELNPFLDREEVVSYCQREGIVVEAYTPLTRGIKLADPTILAIAKKYNKTPAQVLIRWCLERNFVVIPKSIHERRIIENADVYDFNLSPEDFQSMVEQFICCLKL